MRSQKPHKDERSGADGGVSALSYVATHICRLVITVAASNDDPLNRKLHPPSLKHSEHKAMLWDANARQQTSKPTSDLVFKGILLYSSLPSNIMVPSLKKLDRL